MKRILSTLTALSAVMVANQAYATDFVLSGNNANPLYGNFNITYQDATDTSAFLQHLVGVGSFTDNFFFAPLIPSVGSGSSITNVTANLQFAAPPNGLTITGYALDAAVKTALENAFLAADYSTYLPTILGAATLANQVYFQAGTGDTLQQQLTNVPLSDQNFYKITVSGQGNIGGSLYSGNLSSTAVPEPATWAMMLAGFGAIGFVMRNRRKPQPKVRFAF